MASTSSTRHSAVPSVNTTAAPAAAAQRSASSHGSPSAEAVGQRAGDRVSRASRVDFHLRRGSGVVSSALSQRQQAILPAGEHKGLDLMLLHRGAACPDPFFLARPLELLALGGESGPEFSLVHFDDIRQGGQRPQRRGASAVDQRLHPLRVEQLD